LVEEDVSQTGDRCNAVGVLSDYQAGNNFSRVYAFRSADREAVLAEVRRLVETHPSLMDRDELLLPYVTRCYRARLE
jgi:hypothetical protein